MTVLLKVFAQMAMLIIIGIILRKTRVIDDRIQTGLSNILLKTVLPFNVIASSQYEYSNEMVRSLGAVAISAFCYYLFALIFMVHITKHMKIQEKERIVLILTSIFANTGFVGFPLMQSIYGGQGLLLAACYTMIFNVFMYSYGEHLISGKKINVKNLLMNPVSTATIIAVILFILPWRMPQAVTDSIKLYGDMTVPMAMVIVGSTLATVDIQKLFTDKYSYVCSAFRMVIFPGIMLGAMVLLRQFISISPVTASTIVLMTGLPCGSVAVIYSERYDCAPKFAARNFCQSIVFMVITIPLLTVVTSLLFK